MRLVDIKTFLIWSALLRTPANAAETRVRLVGGICAMRSLWMLVSDEPKRLVASSRRARSALGSWLSKTLLPGVLIAAA